MRRLFAVAVLTSIAVGCSSSDEQPQRPESDMPAEPAATHECTYTALDGAESKWQGHGDMATMTALRVCDRYVTSLKIGSHCRDCASVGKSDAGVSIASEPWLCGCTAKVIGDLKKNATMAGDWYSNAQAAADGCWNHLENEVKRAGKVVLCRYHAACSAASDKSKTIIVAGNCPDSPRPN